MHENKKCNIFKLCKFFMYNILQLVDDNSKNKSLTFGCYKHLVYSHQLQLGYFTRNKTFYYKN